MNFDELGPSWRKQNDGLGGSDVNVLTGVIRRAEREQLKNLLLGIVGFVASLVVLHDFGRMFLNEPNMFVRIGAAMVTLGALAGLPVIVVPLWHSRLTGESTCDYFSQELQRTEKVIASTKSPYWFVILAVLVLGVCLVAYGRLPTQRVVLTIVGSLSIYAVACWGARITVRRAEQLRSDIKELLAEFRQENDLANGE